MRSVLIAEEHDDTRALYSYCFRQAGFDIAEAGDAQTALHDAVAHPPDAVVANLTLPGIDGIELRALLAGVASTAHIPFLLLTSRHGADVYSRAAWAGVDEVLLKPCTPDDLLSRVGEAIERSQGVRASNREARQRSHELQARAEAGAGRLRSECARARELMERAWVTLDESRDTSRATTEIVKPRDE